MRVDISMACHSERSWPFFGQAESKDLRFGTSIDAMNFRNTTLVACRREIITSIEEKATADPSTALIASQPTSLRMTIILSIFII